jgi:hypothetical protein
MTLGYSASPAPSLRGALLSAEARLRAKADATKQSSLFALPLDCFASLAMAGLVMPIQLKGIML